MYRYQRFHSLFMPIHIFGIPLSLLCIFEVWVLQPCKICSTWVPYRQASRWGPQRGDDYCTHPRASWHWRGDRQSHFRVRCGHGPFYLLCPRAMCRWISHKASGIRACSWACLWLFAQAAPCSYPGEDWLPPHLKHLLHFYFPHNFDVVSLYNLLVLQVGVV